MRFRDRSVFCLLQRHLRPEARALRIALLVYAIFGCLGPIPLGLLNRDAVAGQQEVGDGRPSPNQSWLREVPWSAEDSSAFVSQMLEPIAEGSFNVRPVRHDDVSQWEFKGTCRLATPFEDGRSLWLKLVKAERLAILIRNRQSAVLLRLYPSYHQAWAAYAVDNDVAVPSAVRPLELLATDNGRYRRSGGGSVAVHWASGQVVLSRGNLRLLTVPFPAKPGEVVLDGDFRLQDCRWHDFSSLPEDDVLAFNAGNGAAISPRNTDSPPGKSGPGTAHVSATTEVFRPPLESAARMAWENLGGESPVPLEPLPDGSVRLAAPPGREPAYAAFALPDAVLYDVRLEIGRATAGSGIFLADQERKPICGLQFDRTPSEGILWLGFSDARRGVETKNRDPGREIIPVTRGKLYVRLLWGAGTVKWMVSPDGTHWSLCGPHAERIDRKPMMLGVFLTSGNQDRVLELRGISLREDILLPDWPSREWLGLVPQGVARAENIYRWWPEVRMARPLGAPVAAWTAACAWKTLAENPFPWLYPDLLRAYWLAVLDSDIPFAEKLRGSRILAGYMNARDWGVWNLFYERMEEAAIEAARRGEKNVFEAHSELMIRTPLWTEWQRTAFSDALFRGELFTHIYHGEDQAAADLALQPLFWAVPGDDFVSPSMRRLSRGALARHPRYCPPGLAIGAESADPSGPVTDDDKDAYAFRRELDAMLREQAWSEAAERIWTVCVSKTPPSFFPHPDRDDLLLGMSCLVRVLEERHPELKEALSHRSEEQSQVLVREAQRRGDERLAVSVAEGLPGLASAAQAAEWLGDRRAVLGRFAEARSWYETAVAYSANETDRRRIAEKQTRVLGVPSGDNPDPIETVNATDAAWCDADTAIGAEWEGPAERVVSLFEIAGDRMVRPECLPERDFDWPVRQLGVTAAEDCLIINNQRDVVCYRFTDGVLLWEQRLGGDDGNRSVPLAKMRPILHGETVFCRRCTSRGVEVAALSLLDGQVIWNVLPLDGAVSDPWFVGNELFVLAADRLGAGQMGVMLVSLDPERGTVLQRIGLFQLRRVWSDDLNILVYANAGTFFAQGEGVVFRADYSGRVRWLREQPWIPPSDRSWWQAHPWYVAAATAPLVRGGRVYVHQPGSWTVESVDVETGEPIWSRSDGRLRSILAEWNGRLWLQTEDGLLVLEEADGRMERFAPLPNLLGVGFLEGTQQLWCATSREVPGKRDEREWRFLRLDADTGRVLGAMSVPAEGKDWQFFGPVVPAPDAIVFMTASRSQPALRRCYRMELSPKSPSPLSSKYWDADHRVR